MSGIASWRDVNGQSTDENDPGQAFGDRSVDDCFADNRSYDV